MAVGGGLPLQGDFLASVAIKTVYLHLLHWRGALTFVALCGRTCITSFWCFPFGIRSLGCISAGSGPGIAETTGLPRMAIWIILPEQGLMWRSLYSLCRALDGPQISRSPWL